MAESVRVLVVDDSSFFRKRIRNVLEASPQISVVGEAANGEEALRLNQQLSPDLVTMDVAMPVLDGISAVRRIMREHPTDIIMFSSLTKEGAQSTLDALDAGAVDFISKPTGGNEPEDKLHGASLLRERVLQIAHGSKQRGRIGPSETRPLNVKSVKPKISTQSKQSGTLQLIVIGASTGGPIAVQQILTQLPANYPYPVLVAVHMPEAFTGTYAQRLDGVCQLRVKEARNGDALNAGQVLIAPGGYQTQIQKRGGKITVDVQSGGEHLYKPSIDNCFSSAAKSLGNGVLGIVLTGMGSDGAMGAAMLKQSGSLIWSQDEASSVVYGMPQAVAKAGATDRVLSLSDLGEQLKGIS